MRSQVRTLNDHGLVYEALAICCPGCALVHAGGDGLHMLPIRGGKSPSWDWNGDLDAPTLNPSILTRSSNADGPSVCHSYLRAGVFDFLTDCTHALAGQSVPMPDLPAWFTDRS
jgi:hypothetical protein